MVKGPRLNAGMQCRSERLCSGLHIIILFSAKCQRKWWLSYPEIHVTPPVQEPLQKKHSDSARPALTNLCFESSTTIFSIMKVELLDNALEPIPDLSENELANMLQNFRAAVE